jgi:RNA polymerase sigma factor (sigma-70 family)
MELDDLESLMLEVLWISAMSWDPKRGTLGTYAVNLMRWHAMRRSKEPHRPCGIRHAPDGYQPLRLDAAATEDGTPLGWNVQDPRDRIEPAHETEATERAYQDLLAQLPERTRDIVECRFSGLTLEEIGQRHGVTRERIRQILKEMERVMVAA